MTEPERRDADVAEDPRPWEAGGVRRDCAPHRERWLVLLGGGAFFCSGWSLVVLVVLLQLWPELVRPGPAGVPWIYLYFPAWVLLLPQASIALAATGLASGLPAVVLAGQDAKRMKAGSMDPGGLRLARRARGAALAGTLLGGAMLLVWFGLCWF